MTTFEIKTFNKDNEEGLLIANVQDGYALNLPNSILRLNHSSMYKKLIDIDYDETRALRLLSKDTSVTIQNIKFCVKILPELENDYMVCVNDKTDGYLFCVNKTEFDKLLNYYQEIYIDLLVSNWGLQKDKI